MLYFRFLKNKGEKPSVFFLHIEKSISKNKIIKLQLWRTTLK